MGIKGSSPTTFVLVLILLGSSLLVPARVCGQGGPNPKLEAAIATLRHVEQNRLTATQMTQKGKEIDAAWEAIRAAGPEGITRLKQEVQAVTQRGEHDDYFKLNASALLWYLGRAAEAETIAAIWNSTPLKTQYNYVFYTAFEAAQTQDPRVLPMLLAVLRDREGEIYVGAHSMDVGWPLAQEFVWGGYGAKGLPVLAQLLRTAPDPATRIAALHMLTASGYVESLPVIRDLAVKGSGEEHFAAIQALGMFGDPQDFDFLISGLRSNDAKTIYIHVFALHEYEDLRAVPHLIPVLQMKNDDVVPEVVKALFHLPNRDSYDALELFCRSTKSDTARSACAEGATEQLAQIKLDWPAYAKMTPSEKEQALLNLRQKDEAEFALQAGDKALTHDQLLEALTEWKTYGRAFIGADQVEQRDPANPSSRVSKPVRYGWVEERHVLSVATPADVDQLLDARAKIYRRLSDECLEEVRRINVIVHRLVRSTYRQAVGVTDKVASR